MNRRALFLLILAAGSLARPAFAACPGVSTCALSACPAGATQVSSGKSIQKAINAAVNGTTICVAPGTYTDPLNFLGRRITLVSSGGPSMTILDGAGGGPVVTFNHSEGADSVLDGFTITNGQAVFGGGIAITNASPTLRNLIVKNNMAVGDSYSRGGGVAVGGPAARPSILCSQFLSNQAAYAGGGMVTYASADPYLRNDDFEFNTAPYGGAIAAYNSGRLDVGTTSFLSNRAEGDGGAIHAGVVYGNVLVRNCWLKGNSAGSNGGALWVPAGLAQVVNCTFDGNRALTGGAVAAGLGGMVDVAGTLFVNNHGAALVNTAPGSNTAVVNHYNGFFGNTGGDYLSTYGDLSPLLLDPQLSTCCPAPGSPAIGAGIPDYLFNNAYNGLRNDMGACGGPSI